MTLELPPQLYSSQHVASVVGEIKQYTTWYDHERVKHQVSGEAPERLKPFALSEGASLVLSKWQDRQPITSDSLVALTTELEKLKDTAPTIHITLAALPADGMKQALVAWMRLEINPNALVTFRFSSSLLGGMVVRVGSHILDWSFRRQLLAKRDGFTEVLRRV